MSDGKPPPQTDLAYRAGRAWRYLTDGGRSPARPLGASRPRRRSSFFRRVLDNIFWLVIAVVALWVIVNVLAHLRG